jgi:hypothetical protein
MSAEAAAAPPRSWITQLTAVDGTLLGARLTCLTLLFVPVGGWYLRPAVLVLAAAELLFSGFCRSHWLWLALDLLTRLRAALDWPLADNHAYLLAYWCTALAIATWTGDPTTLSRNARLLIGVTFAFAALQKWTSPSYVNDVFSLTTFLLDDRFEDLVVLLTRVSYEPIDAARDYLRSDYRSGPPAGGLPFELPWSFLLLARVSTWWNLLDQALVAVAFLVPPTSRLGRLRNPILLLFCFVTYAVAPVASFGWLLLSMGVTQSDKAPSVRYGYLAAFILLAFYYEVPWAEVLVETFEMK